MFTQTQLQFLVLLRAGLWNKAEIIDELTHPKACQAHGNEVINQPIDWTSIYRISREQTVVGLIADAIGNLPPEQQPAKAIAQRFAIDKLNVERSHLKLNAVLNLVVGTMNEIGTRHVLLKGQGVAQNYNSPTSRVCGDIDLYIGEANYRKACEAIKDISDSGAPASAETIKHASYIVKGIDIEIHRMTSTLDSNRCNKALQAWTQKTLDEEIKLEEGTKTLRKLETWDNGGTEIFLPEPNYNAIFLIIHMMRHLTSGGIGLRQCCDWTMFMHSHRGQLDEELIATKLHELGLEKAWNSIATLSINYLGMPSNEIIAFTRREDKTAAKMLAIIFETGNFGKHDEAEKKAHDKHFVIHKWKRFRYHIGYFMKVLPLFPKMEIQYIIKWFFSGIRAAIKGL